jgi:hypothetical protein
VQVVTTHYEQVRESGYVSPGILPVFSRLMHRGGSSRENSLDLFYVCVCYLATLAVAILRKAEWMNDMR